MASERNLGGVKMPEQYFRFDSPARWSSPGIIALARNSCKVRHHWIKCQKCGEWGLPVPTMIDIDTLHRSAKILTVDQFREYKNKRRFSGLIPGSFDCKRIKKIKSLLSDKTEIIFQWFAGSIPFVRKAHQLTILEIFSEANIDLLPSMGGEIFFLVPKTRRFIDGGIRRCLECRADFYDLNEVPVHSEMFFLNDSMKMLINNKIFERLRSKLPNSELSGYSIGQYSATKDAEFRTVTF